MIENLDFSTLRRLLETVFAPQAGEERSLLLLVDLPTTSRPDHPRWRDRRQMAGEWFQCIQAHREELPFDDVVLAVYPNVGSNNRDLPEVVARVSPTAAFPRQEALDLFEVRGEPVPLARLLEQASVVLAPTELSATAPLKLLAKTHDFRGATLPDFRREMIPTLALDWQAVDARVRVLAERLDRAEGADLRFVVAGDELALHLDLRHRTAHVSGGLMRTSQTVGNLPSGEAYIVPYEGERSGDPSTSRGVMPVQLGDEVVLYRIEANRAVEVISEGVHSDAERAALAAEPAYGNLAELGLGVLGAWGITAIGSTLLDEKLGPHLAFGRSDHFGGAVGPKDFHDPEKVIHIDRVYVPDCQPQVELAELVLTYGSDERETIWRSGNWAV